uniref:Fe2OG dioxygenase domain-containing protein n=2 Tax=Aegilops tauschii subsp. strangulata TaxID=200361 RepID=A0A453NLA1_AEGTS
TLYTPAGSSCSPLCSRSHAPASNGLRLRSSPRPHGLRRHQGRRQRTHRRRHHHRPGHLAPPAGHPGARPRRRPLRDPSHRPCWSDDGAVQAGRAGGRGEGSRGDCGLFPGGEPRRAGFGHVGDARGAAELQQGAGRGEAPLLLEGQAELREVPQQLQPVPLAGGQLARHAVPGHGADGAVPEEIPPACRGIVVEFTREVQRLGGMLFELLSEALGLHRGFLEQHEVGCLEGLSVVGHYYPASPQPHLSMGTSRHTDSSFLKVLLQDTVGGLQVLHWLRLDEQPVWVDVPAEPDAFIVNIGDFLQLLSNVRFRSVEYRVLSKSRGPPLYIIYT